MAYEQPGFTTTLVAAADLRTSQYRAVVQSTAGKAALPSDAGRIFGVLQNKPNINEAGTVVCSGITFAEAGAAIATPGLLLEIGADGRFEPRTAGIVCGESMEAASAAGIIIAVYLRPMPL